jgi:hypothetical protein
MKMTRKERKEKEERELKERQRLKPYLDRFYRSHLWKEYEYEEWLKIELRNDRLKELGL